MNMRLAILSFAAALALAGQAFALATEQFGNAPVALGFPTSDANLLTVLNDPSRTYWYEVNGDACFYYKGDAAALNAMLKKFAGKGRELVLHAGPLKRSSLDGTKEVEAQWYVHVPGGISLSHYPDGGYVTDKEPAIHIYLPGVRATGDSEKIAAWIKELDSETFRVRENASRELENQKQGAEAALHAALETSASAEVRSRARAILAKLPSVSLVRLAIPDGVTVIGPEELVARCKKGRASKEPVIRGVAAGQLAILEPDRKRAVEGLVKVLQEDGNEYVRRCVAGDLQREGWVARSALPELKKFEGDADVNVKNAIRAAVASIEKAEEVKDWEKNAKLVADIQRDIAAYLKERDAKR